MNELFGEYGGLVISIIGGIIGLGLFIWVFIPVNGNPSLIGSALSSMLGGVM